MMDMSIEEWGGADPDKHLMNLRECRVGLEPEMATPTTGATCCPVRPANGPAFPLKAWPRLLGHLS